ncbi:LytR C-terminal domain-containing protein [Angustibacter sp. McL0619]|uniref:LytR C-terminal domain-containing protein n=1 Tax=Angustibacter sp. McL0619 TaxID=3415676 RepID=UPI003CE82D54
MGYIEEAPSWRLRKRHRQQITLGLILLLLVAAGGVGYAVYSGAIGGPETVDVAKLPPCPVTKPPLKPEQVVVNVYNATQRNGLAAKTATSLSLRHFAIRTYSNDPAVETIKGTAVIRFGPKGAEGARLVATHVAGVKLINDKRKSAMVDLVLGAKYAGLKPLSATTVAPNPTPTCRTVAPTVTPSGTATPTSTAKATRTAKAKATAR